MAAVLTKKPGGDYATQLTFPAVFAAQAKANNLGSQYYPDALSRPMVLPRGSGLQEDYHEQKRLDANRRCLTAVRDNAASTARFLSSHANYIVPKPVLGQRKYANPSNGNQADIYSSRPIQWNTMSGGVLRTEEGQKWAIGKLKERIPQLDAIKAAKEAFVMGMPMGVMGAESVGITDITTKVELYGLLTRVESDVEQGVVNGTLTGKTVNMSQSALKLMFGFIPYADTREVEEIMESVEYIKGALDGIVEQGQEGVAQQSKAGKIVLRNAKYLKDLYAKMREYLVRMNGVLNRPRKEREKASAVFIKSLGFSELIKKALPRDGRRANREVAAAEAANPNADPDGEDVDDGKYDDDDDDEAGDPRGGPTYAVSSGLSSFPTSSSSSSSAFGPPSGKDAVGPGDSGFDRLAFAEEEEGYIDNPDDPYFIGKIRGPKFDTDNRDKKKFSQGAWLGEEAPAQAAVRSTGSESAEMMDLPEESEESIARRSGLLSAEAASSQDYIDPETGRKMKISGVFVPRSGAEAEFEALQQKVLNYNDTLYQMVDNEVLSSEYFTREYAEAVGDMLKEYEVYTGSKSGRALGAYVLSYYGPKVREIERFLEISQVRKVSEAQKKKSSQ